MDGSGYTLVISYIFSLFEDETSGCTTLNYEIESASNRILKLMRKNFTIEEVEMVLKKTVKIGINTQVNSILGFPEEMEENFDTTKQFIKKRTLNIYEVRIKRYKELLDLTGKLNIPVFTTNFPLVA